MNGIESSIEARGNQAGEDILLIDDTPENLKLLTNILRGSGYRVRSTISGRFALQSVRAKTPGLILLDIRMPEMDGYQVCRQLKAEPGTREIPVIFISALGEIDDKIQAFEAGGVDYITKPFQAAEVLARVRTHLTLARMQQHLEGLVAERTVALQVEIEERKRTEHALREAESRYRTVADFTHDWEYWQAPDGAFLYVSPACEGISGYDVTSLTDDPGLLRRLIVLEDLPIWDKHFHDARKEHKSREVQFRIQRPDGGVRWIGHVCRPVFDAAGAFLGFRASNRDITERKELERELRQAQKLEAIGTLAGGIAHDFNNILAVIFGYTEIVMAEESLPPAFKEHLKEVFSASQRARELVRQILTFCRKSEQKLQPLQVSLIVKEAMKLLRSSLPASIEIKQKIAATDMVLADPTQIHQIVMNLCTNAYHAMRETGGTLAISLQKVMLRQEEILPGQDLVPGEYLRLEVRDTGHGMDKTVIDKIFEPYFTTKKEGEGTGLGLAVVHGIVKSHKGHITVQSDPGRSSIFQIYLPVHNVSGEPRPLSSGAVDSCFPMGTERIMVIDDEKLILKIYHRLLEPSGYTVYSFADSTQALESFRKTPGAVDLVVTDMTMPRLNGLKLARRMLDQRPDCPVILCTGYSELINEHEVKAAGITEFFHKPITKESFLRIVREVLDRQSGGGRQN